MPLPAKGKDSVIARIRARPLRAALREPFTIARGAQTSVDNILVEVTLGGGVTGYGECAPFTSVTGETARGVLSSIKSRAHALEGLSCLRHRSFSRKVAELLPKTPSARAGLEIAVLDAWSKLRRIPLWVYFGGYGSRIATDVTIPIMPAEQAAKAARRIARFGVRDLKIKVGQDPEADAARVAAAVRAAPPRTLIVDGNEGFDTASALRFLRLLRRRDIHPDLFEQPVHRDDLESLQAVSRFGVAIAADESAASAEDVLRLAKRKAVQVVNLKLMKCGVFGGVEFARAARAANLGLMIGGMVESRLAMTCAAHLAAGFGGFRYVDLDTPLFFARDPMRGVAIGRGGVYDLSGVRAGIGVAPKTPLT